MSKFMLSFALFSLIGCGSEAPAPAPVPVPAEAPKPAPAPPPAPEPEAAGPVTPDEEGVVRIEGLDTMKYNTDRIEVTGTKVKLELKHVGKMAKNVMGHNLVVLQSGTDVMAWSATTLMMADSDYIPPNDPKVIAHTKLIGGGESDLIEFELPGPGEYPFVCSFPGHAAIMQGVLVAK